MHKSRTPQRELSKPWEAIKVNQTLRRDIPPGVPEGVEYVQKSDDSRNSAIRIAYRNSLRPSSLPEPRHSSLKFSKFGCFSAPKIGEKKKISKKDKVEKGINISGPGIFRGTHTFVCCLRHPQPGSHTHQKQRDEASIFPWLRETHKSVPTTTAAVVYVRA